MIKTNEYHLACMKHPLPLVEIRHTDVNHSIGSQEHPEGQQMRMTEAKPLNMFLQLLKSIGEFLRLLWLSVLSIFCKAPSPSTSPAATGTEGTRKETGVTVRSVAESARSKRVSVLVRLRSSLSSFGNPEGIKDEEASPDGDGLAIGQPVQGARSSERGSALRRMRVLSVSSIRPEIYIEDWTSLPLSISEYGISAIESASSDAITDSATVASSPILTGSGSPDSSNTPQSSQPTSPEPGTPVDNTCLRIGDLEQQSKSRSDYDPDESTIRPTERLNSRRSYEYFAPQSDSRRWWYEVAMRYGSTPASAVTSSQLWDPVVRMDVGSVPLPVFTSTPTKRRVEKAPQLQLNFESEIDFGRFPYLNSVPYPEIFDFSMYDSQGSSGRKGSTCTRVSLHQPFMISTRSEEKNVASQPQSPEQIDSRDWYRHASYTRVIGLTSPTIPSTPEFLSNSIFSVQQESPEKVPVNLAKGLHEFLAESPRDLRESILARLHEVSTSLDNSGEWNLISLEEISTRLREACKNKLGASWTKEEFLKIIEGEL